MDSVQPLRISKNNTPSSSPAKMAASRPLAEIGSTERRRNSPSYNHATKKAIVSRESSPYTETSFVKASPRDFWSTRDAMAPSCFDENTPEPTSLSVTSPKRRSSIERLRQSGRVKNSNIFALETKDAYDPTSVPVVERPSVNRPLSRQLAGNNFARLDSMRKENKPLRASPQRPGHRRNESEINVPLLSPSKTPSQVPLPPSPEKQGSPSPTKSSLARTSQFGISPESYDPDSGAWSDGDDRGATPRALNRHAKNVTFHEEPPVVNEYEEQTPEPSVSVASDHDASFDSDDFYHSDVGFERGTSAYSPARDDSFDADLENADKTPVVLPEDWTRMSPDEARTDLINAEDDVFEGSQDTTERVALYRETSVTSDGESRPLPPLPPFMAGHKRRESVGLPDSAERTLHPTRILPSPPKRASCTKEDILKITRESSLTLQDRFDLMSGQSRFDRHSKNDGEASHGVAEELTITNLDTGEREEVQLNVAETAGQDESAAELTDLDTAPPRISRESILRNLRYAKYDFEDEGDIDEAGLPIDDYAELAKFDPDHPIPSRENSRENSDTYAPRCSPPYSVEDQEVRIKDEPDEDETVDMAAIPSVDEEPVDPPRSPSRMQDYELASSALRESMRNDIADNDDDEDEDASRYSNSIEPEAESTVLHTQPETEADDGKETLDEAMQLLTVKDYSESASPVKRTSQFMALSTDLGTGDYDFGMAQYITPSPPMSSENTTKLDLINMPQLQPSAEVQSSIDLPRPSVGGADASAPGTPSSVIHRSEEVTSVHEHDDQRPPVPRDEPAVPERQATIKTGGKLKARKSNTQQDLEAMAEHRRLVSAEHPVPAIPAAFRSEIEDDQTHDACSFNENQSKVDSVMDESRGQHLEASQVELSLDIVDLNDGDADGLGLDAEFERVIEGQKKGYLMRQNTKVVVASNRNFSGDSNETSASAKPNDPSMPPTATAHPRPTSRGTKSANSSPRKGSAEQFLRTEPWNGKTRRKSMRTTSVQKAQYRSEPAPPLPGQESALNQVDEDDAAVAGSLEDEAEEGVERGRLFVKVVGVKDLDLPLPKNDRVYFQLTLDNGLHCVTTASLELGRSAPIEQEFELVVFNDVEFQLTLTTKLPPPPAAPTPVPSSPSKSAKSQKSSGFSRLLSSPKKRAEKERLEREAAEAEERRLREEARRKRASIQPTAWDLLHELVNAADGSFARAYVNLKTHEQACFGRVVGVDVPCYNEWALEQDAQVVSSVRSKRGAHAGPVRRPPYVVGQLALQLLYVPKPREAGDEDMPKSMSGAVREMAKARETKEVVHEGHLSQQGGDCQHWRRRFFRLQGPRLTAYHEHTHQKRAVINLSKAARLVDDRTILIADPTSGPPSAKGKGRRKSAFAEEDEGYAYVEEGFRIRFANGETIDFYADSRAEKDVWMEMLSQVIGTKNLAGSKAARWTDVVLARERSQGVAPAAIDERTASSQTNAPVGASVKDFSRAKAETERKPVAPPASRARMDAAKSAPTSPVKGSHAPTRNAAHPARPSTPPMNPRRAGRARDALKSMIF